ncbi:MAG: helix-turn-helix domain-containing protein [Kiritimatiellia bacterium]|jgi:DNA-binding transcriptional regulator YiaG|nr:helix-turn-helix domain-containing protein [Kiritimatiellia bacterium]
MKKAAEATDGEHGPLTPVTVKNVREILGITQTELASALGISAKAVQSYEQGWRDTPDRVMIQILVLLAMYRRKTMKDVPCWEIRHCSEDQRSVCPSFTICQGLFCWLLGSRVCKPEEPAESKTLACSNCSVAQRLLKGEE